MGNDNPSAGIMGLPAEAPTTGTPSAAPVTEPAKETPAPETAPPVGTPEPSTASAATEQKPPEPVADEATKQKQRDYQTRYQGIVEFLKEHSPDTLEAYRNDRFPPRDDQGRFTAPEPKEQQTATEVEPQGELDYTDPQDFIKAVTDAVNKTLDAREKKTAEVNQQAEWSKADMAVKGQMSKLLATVPQDIAQQAFTDADMNVQRATYGRMNIMDIYRSPNGPYHAAQAVVSALNDLMSKQQVNTSTAETVAEQVSKAMAGMAATQPAPAAPPGPASALTPEQEHAKKLREAGGNPVGLLFGNPG